MTDHTLTIRQKIQNPHTLGYIAAFLSSAFYASISTFGRHTAIKQVDPLVTAALATLVAGIALTPVSFEKKVLRQKNHNKKENSDESTACSVNLFWDVLRSFSKRDVYLLLAITLLGAVIPTALYMTGLQNTSASNASIISNSEIVFAVVLAVVFFKEKLQKTGVIATILVISGIILVNTGFENPLESFSEINPQNIGNLLILATMIFWALDDNLSKTLTKRNDNIGPISQIKCLLGGAILLGIAILLGREIDPKEQLTSIVLLGTIGLAAPLYLFYYALRQLGTVRTILAFSTSSVFGIGYAVAFLGENIMAYHVMAVVLMGLGIYIIQKDKQAVRVF